MQDVMGKRWDRPLQTPSVVVNTSCAPECTWDQSPQPTQDIWVFLFCIAEFWQTFWVIWENGSYWSNLRLKMSFFALGRLKNHKVPHLHPNSTMFMPLDRLQLKIYAFSGKFNVCSKCVLLWQIKICRDFTLQTQIFTQKYRSWLRFYSEFLRKNLAVEVSGRHVTTLTKACNWRTEWRTRQDHDWTMGLTKVYFRI